MKNTPPKKQAASFTQAVLATLLLAFTANSQAQVCPITPQPMDVLVVLDNSASVSASQFAAAQEAVANVATSVLSRPGTRMAVVNWACTGSATAMAGCRIDLATGAAIAGGWSSNPSDFAFVAADNTTNKVCRSFGHTSGPYPQGWNGCGNKFTTQIPNEFTQHGLKLLDGVLYGGSTDTGGNDSFNAPTVAPSAPTQRLLLIYLTDTMAMGTSRVREVPSTEAALGHYYYSNRFKNERKALLVGVGIAEAFDYVDARQQLGALSSRGGTSTDYDAAHPLAASTADADEGAPRLATFNRNFTTAGILTAVEAALDEAKPACVTVRKQSSGGTGTFSFTAGTNGLPASLSLDTTAQNPVQSSHYYLTALRTETSITETIPSNWALDSVGCVNAATNAAITVTANTTTGQLTIPEGAITKGARLACTFNNVMKPRVTLRKISEGGAGSFSFTGTNGIASQTLTTTASGTPVEGAVQTLTTVGQQTTITESGPPAGYTLTDASCTGLPTNGTATLNQATRTLTLNAAATAAGAELVCTFTNARAPVLRVRKELPNGRTVAGNQFVLGIAQGASVLATATTSGATNAPAEEAVLNPAVAGTTYTLSESAAGSPATVPGHYATTYSCTNTRSGAPAAPSGSGASFNIVPVAGDNLTCTFRNVAKPRLTLVKTVTNDNGGTQAATAWTLTASGPTTIGGATGTAAVTAAVVDAGTYTLSESATPTGYVASLYSCVKNGEAAVAGNSIALAAGDVATCTINNNDSNVSDLRIESSAAPNPVRSGERVQFSLTVTNDGPGAANGAVVRNPAAPGLDCTAAGLPAPTCVVTGGALCPASLTASGLQAGVTVPTLPNGGVVTLGLVCTVTASGF